MNASASLRQEVFAGNRAVGRIALSVTAAAGASRRARVHEAGSLRVRFPNGENDGALDAVVVNTAGGMAGGDRFDIDVKVGAGARLNVTSAAAEKIYRATGPDTQVGVKLEVDAGGTLAWLPQETILFNQVRLRRSLEVELARDAKLLLAEAVIFGRSAMGETVSLGRLFDRRRVRVEGSLLYAETIRLDGNVAQRLTERAVAGGGVAIASMIKFPGNDDDVARLRAAQATFTGEVGVSAWNGFAVVRLVAIDGAALRHDLACALTALGVTPLPRLWLN